jgi:hypothetical protein
MNRIKVNIPEDVRGSYRVIKKTGTIPEVLIEVSGHQTSDQLEPHDDYTILWHDQIEFVMTDNRHEYIAHQSLWDNMSGHILIGGLGLGMVNHKLILEPNVLSVTIVEKYQEVIDLVWDHCPKDSRFTLVHADVHSWIPDKSYNLGWFDTWGAELPYESLETYKSRINTKYGSVCESIKFWEPSDYFGFPV